MTTARASDQELEPPRAVYLIGAGASHGCVEATGLDDGILMHHLREPLRRRVRALVDERYSDNHALHTLVNEVVDEKTDYEHIITFLDQSVSATHRRFAEELREIFEDVLRARLDSIEELLGAKPVGLYEALLDMYEVPGFGETLSGILTLNYDEYIEHAATVSLGKTVDFGVSLRDQPLSSDSVRLLKLHGSFGWEDEWPIGATPRSAPLWIPPGIQKAKDRYPFNALWGLAREMLDCDILRIVGCQLGPKDWDLVSLLFSTRHVNVRGRRYVVEVIDAPGRAEQLKDQFPFLDVRSLFELRGVGGGEAIGPRLVSELGGGKQETFASLPDSRQKELVTTAGWSRNWFRIWLKQMAETAFLELGSIETPAGCFRSLLEED